MRVFAAVLLVAACQDLHEFGGTWHGDPSPDPNLSNVLGSQYGSIDLSINVVDHTHVAGTLNGTPFASLKFASADALSDVRVGRDALRTYFVFLNPGCVADVPGPLVILSLFPDQRIELRLIQGNDMYGLYELHR